ncbi:alkaline phosphatase D [Rhizomicrobium palustre]|uniref:Alkaline phosphatase D n=1 Tax=Rhizomicrobium palustre TaxID=189966 RepID=A0A846MY51_9PROT|nr:ectonucleotide pyrophosphatase/phosphodiesterase [Rhizomicrobium palustre]NIK88051.1 alkaline phosphatase D [Rhizomicrobium palustre]
MRRMKYLFAVFLLLAAPALADSRTTVVVLFDGFSPFMMEGVVTPNFDRLAREGVSSRHLVPVFPTLSMVNHTSFATGCWPAHHGIVSNEFLDPTLGAYGTKMDRADAAWRTGCETFWQAAKRQGVSTAAFNIVGRWSSKTGPTADVINEEVPWSQHDSDDTIIAKAVAALNGGTRLVTLYFDYPDSVAHGDGVHGDKTKAVVAKADAVVGKLIAALQALPAARKPTLIIGADHGMTKVEKVINLGKLRAQHHFEADVAYGSGSAMLYLKPGQDKAAILAALKTYSDVFETYEKGHFPSYAHIGTSARVGDILLITRPPYDFEGPEIMKEADAKAEENVSGPVVYEPQNKWFNSKHGFKPDVEAMHAIFYAWGPGIAKGKVLPRVEMIDVAPTVLKLMGLKPGLGSDGKAVKLGR